MSAFFVAFITLKPSCWLKTEGKIKKNNKNNAWLQKLD